MPKLSIVLLLDDKTDRFVIGLSRRLSRRSDTMFTLDGRRFYPHITLSGVRVTRVRTAVMKRDVARIASRCAPFRVSLSDFSESRRYFGWNCVRDARLSGLRKRAVSYMAGLDGVLLSKPVYRPHVTITRFRRRSDVKKGFEVIRSKKAGFIARYIALCRNSHHGTVTKIIAKFRLEVG